MIKLPKKYEEMYEHIRLATPEYEDYKEYVEESNIMEPASKEQFIDVATFIAAKSIPNKLNLTDEEKRMLSSYHLMNRLNHLFDVMLEYDEV